MCVWFSLGVSHFPCSCGCGQQSRFRSVEPVIVMANTRGGQDSVALMHYLARVKDECKPAIYSAFISLMNAYHGNM